jgi:hypothetical protein
MRCRQCILTDQVPGSDFDSTGLCTWCRTGYPNYQPRGIAALDSCIRKKLRPDAKVDCVVGISGGKDSSFVLWAMKKHFGLRVHAFTYDHDGVEPLARENMKRLCDSLDVPLAVESLGPGVHIQSFRDYFSAWLDHPTAVSAGMTCVACKHLHLFGNKLARELNAPFVAWGKCPLEDSPFLALKYDTEKKGREGLVRGGVLLTREVASSPQLVGSIVRNFSLTLQGCLAVSPDSPFIKWRFPTVEQLFFFDYWPWNPKEIVSTITRETGWRRPTNRPTDWHSDCIIDVFKEYVFQRMLGVSYTDGFLSNQLRAGILTREEAWEQLLRSKEYFANAMPAALERVGLAHLAGRIDPSCFRIGDDSPSLPSRKPSRGEALPVADWQAR